MATVRDPAFWRRFSLAVHLDEEAQASSSPPRNARPSLKHAGRNSDSWLDRQKAKESQRTFICWIFWICFLVFIAGIVLLVLWLKASGILGAKKDVQA